eukprot:g1582.t1
MLGWNPRDVGRLFELLDTDRARYLSWATTSWLSGAELVDGDSGSPRIARPRSPEAEEAEAEGAKVKFTKAQSRRMHQRLREHRHRVKCYEGRARNEIPGSHPSAGTTIYSSAPFITQTGSKNPSTRQKSKPFLMQNKPAASRILTDGRGWPRSVQGLSNSIWCFAKVLFREESTCAAIASAAMAKACELTSQEMGNTSWAFARLLIVHQQLLEVIASQAELHGLAMSVGADLGVDPTAFGDIRTLFHRFDFSGDGHLDEQETFELIQYMLRVFRDLQQKRAAHLSQRPVVQDFGASIKFKGLEELLFSERIRAWLAGILKQICAGILYLHNNRCMHCDIKEPNVMISRDADWNEPTPGDGTKREVPAVRSTTSGENVVVIDFGLARDFKKGSTGVMGTPGYMPPEVWTHGVWTIFGDVFSLGHWANEGPVGPTTATTGGECTRFLGCPFFI